MALTKLETLAITATAAAASHSPTTTLANIANYGSDYVLMSTNQNIIFTVDGVTLPVVGSGSEVGILLRSTDLGIILSPEEFANLKIKYVTAAARVAFQFLTGDRHRLS
jgi:hypothetical protein